MPVSDCTAGEFEALLANDRDAEAAPLDDGVKVTVKVTDWPAVSAAGNEIPESANSVLLRLADVTVTEAPLAVSLPVSGEFDPTVTLPKLRLAGETVNWPAAVPVPESAMLSGEFDAVETTERLPLAAVALVGVKVAVKVTLSLGVRLMGKFNPLIEKAAPVKFACEIVAVEPPVLVSVSDKFALLPTCTLGNASEVGFAESNPGVTPVPESGMLSGELGASETMLNAPLAAPALAGVKIAVKVTLWLTARVTGGVRPAMEKPVPLADACEMVTVDPVALVKVSD